MGGAWEPNYNVLVGVVEEEWSSIPSHPFYEASNLGRVRSIARKIVRSDGVVVHRPGRVLKSWVHRSGYILVKLYEGDGNSTTCYVQRVILEAFIGPCPEGMECRHLDGDSKNNTLKNLQWGTPKENGEDKVRHGTTTKGLCGRHYNQGQISGNAKLSDSDVRKIREFFDSGKYTIASINRMFSIVTYSVIHKVVHRLAWTHIK